MNLTRRLLLTVACAFQAFALSGCGGGGGGSGIAPTDPASGLRTVTVAGFPHPVDIYAADAPRRIVIFLHGGAGTKEGFAFKMGVTRQDSRPTQDTVNWSWVNAGGLVAAFPQGQALTGSPLATTWSNHVMDSGQDDVGFLNALADQLQAAYGAALPVSIVGHSNGGMMANRMWCESPGRFSAFVALAGPSSVFYLSNPCVHTPVRPYLGFVGDQDGILQGSENWSQAQWRILFDNGQAIVDADLIGEWSQFVSRAASVCGENPDISAGVVSGNVTTWEACAGRLRIQRAAGLDHDLGTPSSSNPTVLSDRALAFISAQEGR